tara:strand:+ start:7859 stop:8788 length:930 start_codon:yes stop_codon:yes gene_type:complete
MKMKKPKFWDKKYHTFFSIILLPISFFYRIIVSVKKITTTKKEFTIPIICIGNIYIGGTGKTPLSMKIWEIFKNEKKPVIIKKNYKNHKDEIELIKKYSKIITSEKRSEGINLAIEKKFDLAILDDGYQDFEIKKNINIICFNSQQGIGNGQTIPSGPLREKLDSLKNCQIVFINGKKNLEFEDKLKKYNNKLTFFYFNYYVKNLNEFINRKLISFAGIGNPENFFKLLKENHLNIIKEIDFPDHYEYTQKDLENLSDLEKKYNAKLVTTEKDYLRISSFNRRRFGMIPIKVNIDNQEKFIQIIKKFIK